MMHGQKNIKKRGKVVPVHDMKTCRKREDMQIASPILNHSTRCRWLVIFMHWLLPPRNYLWQLLS